MANVTYQLALTQQMHAESVLSDTLYAQHGRSLSCHQYAFAHRIRTDEAPRVYNIPVHFLQSVLAWPAPKR